MLPYSTHWLLNLPLFTSSLCSFSTSFVLKPCRKFWINMLSFSSYAFSMLRRIVNNSSAWLCGITLGSWLVISACKLRRSSSRTHRSFQGFCSAQLPRLPRYSLDTSSADNICFTQLRRYIALLYLRIFVQSISF